MEILGRYERGIPSVSVRIAGKTFNAIMDTGFDGFAMLPLKEIESLRLPELGKTVFLTADGRVGTDTVYEGLIDFCGRQAPMEIDSTDGNFVLVGMRLLRPLRVVMEPSRNLLMLSNRDP